MSKTYGMWVATLVATLAISLPAAADPAPKISAGRPAAPEELWLTDNRVGLSDPASLTVTGLKAVRDAFQFIDHLLGESRTHTRQLRKALFSVRDPAYAYSPRLLFPALRLHRELRLDEPFLRPQPFIIGPVGADITDLSGQRGELLGLLVMLPWQVP